MKLSVLAANIAFGIPGMDRPLPALARHIGVYGWKFLPAILFAERLNKMVDLTKVHYPERLGYVVRRTNLARTIEMVREQDADVVVLNELIIQAHQEEIEAVFTSMGYTWVWATSLHQEQATVSTVLATKLPVQSADQLPIIQKAKPGGGGGFGVIRLADLPLTIVGLHCSSLYGYLWKEQMEELAGFVAHERDRGRQVVMAGDFNATPEEIGRHTGFSKAELETADLNRHWTCPVWQFGGRPHRTAIDHILIPNGWECTEFSTGEFGSDHLWVRANLETPALRDG